MCGENERLRLTKTDGACSRGTKGRILEEEKTWNEALRRARRQTQWRRCSVGGRGGKKQYERRHQ